MGGSHLGSRQVPGSEIGSRDGLCGIPTRRRPRDVWRGSLDEGRRLGFQRAGRVERNRLEVSLAPSPTPSRATPPGHPGFLAPLGGSESCRRGWHLKPALQPCSLHWGYNSHTALVGLVQVMRRLTLESKSQSCPLSLGGSHWGRNVTVVQEASPRHRQALGGYRCGDLRSSSPS